MKKEMSKVEVELVGGGWDCSPTFSFNYNSGGQYCSTAGILGKSVHVSIEKGIGNAEVYCQDTYRGVYGSNCGIYQVDCLQNEMLVLRMDDGRVTGNVTYF